MRERPSMWDVAGMAGLTGGATGAAVGGASALLRGLRSPAALARAAAAAGLGAGAVTGGGTLLGTALMGSPGRNEDTPYTSRAGLGAGVLGSAAGGGLGALLASGILAKNPRIASWLAKRAPTDNLIGDLYSYLSRQPTTAKTLLGTGVGSGLGGLGAGYFGASEGMGVDFVNSQAGG